MFWKMSLSFLKRFLWNVAIWITQTINTFTFGDPDETLCSRLGKYYPKCFLTRLINFLFFWDGGKHIENSIEPDEGSDSVFYKGENNEN